MVVHEWVAELVVVVAFAAASAALQELAASVVGLAGPLEPVAFEGLVAVVGRAAREQAAELVVVALRPEGMDCSEFVVDPCLVHP